MERKWLWKAEVLKPAEGAFLFIGGDDPFETINNL